MKGIHFKNEIGQLSLSELGNDQHNCMPLKEA